jgi:hypothetical protein
VANLVPGGEQDPGYVERVLDWANGTALCLVVGLLAAYVARSRRQDRRWITPVIAPATVPAAPSGRGVGGSFIAAATLVSFAVYAATAWFVFSGRPLLIDEVVQVMQARWYVAGSLSVPTPALPEFFAITHVVDAGGRMFGQFPPGGPAMLAIGSWADAEWLVGPACGAVTVALFALALPSFEPEASRRWLRGTTALFAAAPFAVFMFASHMNHATAMLWLMLAIVGVARCTRSQTPEPRWGLVAGVALGIAATIRPLDAAAFALPTAAWLSWRARLGRGHRVTLAASGVGVGVPLALMLWVNARTTGAPLLFGYDLLWGPSHALGFHEAPWGPAHTPARGLELVSIYFTRLGTYLFESPVPGTLFVAAGLWGARRVSPLDAYLATAAGLLVVGYWAYWHDGFFLGPRFYFPLLPVLVIWSARGVSHIVAAIRERGPIWRGVRASTAAALMLVAVSLVFIRIPSYRNGLTSMRLDVEAAARQAGVADALVLVKESWGSRLVVRMWALGVPHAAAERIYRNTDVCRLELAVGDLEARTPARLESEDPVATLMSLASDSAGLERSAALSGFTESRHPDFPWPPSCQALRALDEQGHSHLAPFLLARDGNVYARWLPEREGEIARAHPGRPVYRLDRAGPEADAGLVWRPISLIRR